VCFGAGVVSIAAVGGAGESSSIFLVEWVRSAYATGTWRVSGILIGLEVIQRKGLIVAERVGFEPVTLADYT